MSKLKESFPTEKEAEEEFSVEKILNKRIVKGIIECFLKWKGYSNNENTWEPEENLDCADLIAEFEEQCKMEKATVSGIRYEKKKQRKRKYSNTPILSEAKKKAEKKKPEGLDKNLKPELEQQIHMVNWCF